MLKFVALLKNDYYEPRLLPVKYFNEGIQQFWKFN